jgi:RNA polymerase sigma-70 factor, ECF subfamily
MLNLSSPKYSPVDNSSSTPSEFPSEEVIQQWIIEAKTGNEDAFARLVETFQSRLQAVIYRILLDWEETRDVAQETFVRAYQALNRYQPHGKFQSWLFQIGVRQAYDVLRKKKHRPVELVKDEVQTPKEVAIRDETVNQNELAKLIEQAVQQLPSQQRVPFVLAEYEGYGYREIADVMGSSVKSIERHLYRAREALREKLKGYLSSQM